MEYKYRVRQYSREYNAKIKIKVKDNFEAENKALSMLNKKYAFVCIQNTYLLNNCCYNEINKESYSPSRKEFNENDKKVLKICLQGLLYFAILGMLIISSTFLFFERSMILEMNTLAETGNIILCYGCYVLGGIFGLLSIIWLIDSVRLMLKNIIHCLIN